MQSVIRLKNVLTTELKCLNLRKKVHDKNLFSLQKEEFQKRQSKLKSLSPQSDLSLIASTFPKLEQIDATEFKYLLASEHKH